MKVKQLGVVILLVGALAGVSAFSARPKAAGVNAGQEAKKLTPADGHDIHVTAPHMVNGHVMGPYHHYCKAVSETVLEQIEYFVAKPVARANVPLDTWNKFYHDHAVEIATGRVQVLDRSPEEAKKIAEAAAQTDGIIFHLWWPDDAKAPSGEVLHPQAVGHKPRTQ